MHRGLPFLLAGTLLGATPAAAQMAPAPVADVFESYNACFAATNTTSLAPAELEKLGWQRATVQSSSGEAMKDAPVIFGHADKAPLILLSGLEGKGVCIVTARIASYAVFDHFKAAFGGKLPKPDKKGDITYQAEGRFVQIAPTGSRDKPSLKLVVGTLTETP